MWRPADIAAPVEWTVTFSDDERDELVAATTAARADGATVDTIDRGAFPLPTLAGRVVEWSRLLNEGRGFLLLRRFPVDLLDPPDVELAYVGLGAHLGTPVGQDKDATLLGHVRDEGVERTGPEVRLYRTRQRQDFHTDGSDLVGLLCLQRARRGGESRIASSAAVYNELLRLRPDLVEVLYEPRILHAREAYEDHEDPARRRHLLRLWLTAHHFSSVEGFLRGGIPRQRA